MRRRTSPAAAELVCPLFPDILPWLLCQDPLFNISSLFPHSNSLHFFFHVTQVDGHLALVHLKAPDVGALHG